MAARQRIAELEVGAQAVKQGHEVMVELTLA